MLGVKLLCDLFNLRAKHEQMQCPVVVSLGGKWDPGEMGSAQQRYGMDVVFSKYIHNPGISLPINPQVVMIAFINKDQTLMWVDELAEQEDSGECWDGAPWQGPPE